LLLLLCSVPHPFVGADDERRLPRALHRRMSLQPFHFGNPRSLNYYYYY
jgi:hypothetical protein